MKKNSRKTNRKSVRLVSHIYPTRYDLTLSPDLEAFIFSGQETISINIERPTREITLHAKDLKIETTEIKKGKEIQFATISYDTEKETVTFKFKKPIDKGSAKLVIVFSGVINDTLRGFYKSKYEIEGVTKHIATTQFEATDARRAFPCFDEPAHKAVFNVSLIVPGTHTAISNTLPESIEEHVGGYKIIKFAPTPLMSTYLLAFIIGEFEYIEGFTKGNKKSKPVQIRVFTTKGKKHQAKFALEVAIKSLEFYNEYFDIPYPLPILDMIAIPDFESGAMENWGAITYRETAILVDDEHSSLSNKQWVALVIAHEIAHQWFGNLVTMHWWTDLWLNEGFASYIEYLAVDHVFPKWRIWDQFLTADMAQALRLDSLKNSHPIEITVHHPNEINEIFDSVSYAKGASVIRMLASYIGGYNFKHGLRHYLKKHSYKNTETIDLWKSFEKVSGSPVAKLMANWTGKTGYPLLTLNNKNNKYSVSQQRFFSSRVSSALNKEKTIWQVPFIYESNSKPTKNLLTNYLSTISGNNIGKINKGEQSLVRVRYDQDTLLKLKEEISRGKISVHDRLGIIRDLFALAEGGYIKTSEALEFALAYKSETEYIVWVEIASGVNKIRNVFSNTFDNDSFNRYSLSLFSPLAKRLGWEKNKNEDNSSTFLRSLALSHAGIYGDKDVIREANTRFKNKDKNKIEADIRSVVYTIVAANGGIKEWKEFEKLHNNTNMHEEKDRYASAMAEFKDEKLIKKTLVFALSNSVRDQNAPFIITTVWRNIGNREITWKFVKDNWETILKRYGMGGHFLSRILPPLGNHTKVKDAEDAKKFFAKNLAPGAERTLEQAYERIHSNAAWIRDDKTDIKNWLNKNFNK